MSIVVVSVTSLGFVEARRCKKNAVANEGLIDQLEREVVRTRQDGERELVETDDAWRKKFGSLEARGSQIESRNCTLSTEKQVLFGRLAESDRSKKGHAVRVKELLDEKIVRLTEHDAMKKERDTAIERLRTSEGTIMVLRHRQHGYRRRA